MAESDGEDYGFCADVTRDDGQKFAVEFTIWDSGEADDGVYGEHGNFHLSICVDGGLIVGTYVPHNYTDRCWVDYADADEWDRRLTIMERSTVSAIDAINEYRAN